MTNKNNQIYNNFKIFNNNVIMINKLNNFKTKITMILTIAYKKTIFKKIDILNLYKSN